MKNRETEIRFNEILDQIRKRFDLLVQPSNTHSALDIDVLREDIRNLYRILDTFDQNSEVVEEVVPEKIEMETVEDIVVEAMPLKEVVKNTPSVGRQEAFRSVNTVVAPSQDEIKTDDTIAEQHLTDSDDVNVVVHKQQLKSKSRLNKFIGLNDKFQLVKHLFAGNEVLYSEFVQLLEGKNDVTEAELFISEELRITHSWDEDSDAYRNLISITQRYFS